MIQLGNLIIYDLEGNILKETGECVSTGDSYHVYPVGVPYLELAYGDMKYETQRLVKIDVTKTPHEPVFEQIVKEQTPEERIAELERLLAEATTK